MAEIIVEPGGTGNQPGASLYDQTVAGKMPGVQTNGRWHGYSWSKKDVDPNTIDESGANIGIRAADFPGLDIDSEHPNLTFVVQQEAVRFLGPAPRRQSRAPRRLLMYRADEPIRKQTLTVLYKGRTHTIEFLAKGQQYLIHGRHPSGRATSTPNSRATTRANLPLESADPSTIEWAFELPACTRPVTGS